MSNVTRYDEAFKAMAVQKVLSPGAPILANVAINLGIPKSTLYSWTQNYATVGVMKKNKSKVSVKKPWSAEEKLQAIINQKTMPENEYGEYLRSRGLLSTDVDIFLNEYFLLLKEKKRIKQDPEVLVLRKEKKDLQSNLNRKDKALAEMSARIVLLKKSHLLWGDPEDEE